MDQLIVIMGLCVLFILDVCLASEDANAPK
jgi:hypothetical protein